VLCLYLMGLNLSNRQIAHEPDLGETDVQAMTEQLRYGPAARLPPARLERRGRDRRGLRRRRPQGPAGRGREKGRRRRLRGAPGRGTLGKDEPPVLGLLQRGGEVVLRMLASVQQKTIRPVIETTVAQGALVHTDGCDVYARLDEWGYGHKTVRHARGGYARDDDGDGFCEVHVNTAEGLWSLPRSWLRSHRGVSQEKLPAYLAFFQVVHNARRRGKTLLATLIGALVA
jgi:transposase-like protein